MSKTWRWTAAPYVLLLAASHVADRRPASPPRPDLRTVTVREVNRGEIRERTIRLAYRDSSPGSSAAPVLLIHGSPGSSEVLHPLADLLAAKFRVITPDLPGFGASSRDLPDYSFAAHAAYVIQLLDALHVACSHLVGYSMGGGVVLNAAARAPHRVSSIVMLSAIGVQEHELTGSYAMNHALHAAQLAAIWTLLNGVPHFGSFHRLPFTVEYARNFYDSDQRPLRSVFKAYSGPMLILHGVHDRNVPVEAAREHHRLVPRSELVEIDADHFAAFTRPAILLPPLVRFLSATSPD